MRLGLLVASLVVMLGLPFEAARAGGVVIHFRDVARSAASRGVESVALSGATATNGSQENGVGVTTQSTSSPGTDAMSGTADAMTGTTGTASSAGTSQAAGAPAGGKAPPGVPLPGTGGPLAGEDVPASAATPSLLTGSVTRFSADDDMADFEAVGCGGATSARGPVGLLPFAVAALALLRRRR